MTRKSILSALVVATLAIGFFFLAFVGFESLKPSAKAISAVPSFSKDLVKVGELEEVRWDFPGKLFVYRIDEASFLIFSMEYSQQWEYYWTGPPFVECQTLTMESNLVSCHFNDKVVMAWDFDGRPQYDWGPPLSIWPSRVVGPYVRYGPGA